MKRLFFYEKSWFRHPGWWYFRIRVDPSFIFVLVLKSELYRINILGFDIELTKLPF